MQELKAKAAKEKFGELTLITEPDYKKAVNEKDTWVVVFLFNYGYVSKRFLRSKTYILSNS